MRRRPSSTRWVASRIALVAAVGLVASGCGGQDDLSDLEASNDIHVEAGDMYFEPDAFAAEAGEITFTMDNVGEAVHDLMIAEPTSAHVIGTTEPGASASGSIRLDAGTYTVICAVPGHLDAGMEATLEVR